MSVVYHERPDWLSYYRSYVIGFALFILMANTGSFGVGMFIILIVAASAAIARQRHEFIIEEDTIVIREGLIARNLTEIKTRHIRGMRIQQNMIERLLGVGSLIAVTASDGESKAELKGIRDPEKVKEMLNKML